MDIVCLPCRVLTLTALTLVRGKRLVRSKVEQLTVAFILSTSPGLVVVVVLSSSPSLVSCRTGTPLLLVLCLSLPSRLVTTVTLAARFTDLADPCSTPPKCSREDTVVAPPCYTAKTSLGCCAKYCMNGTYVGIVHGVGWKFSLPTRTTR